MSFFSDKKQYTRPRVYYALNLDHFIMEPHSHSRCEIMYVVSGGCTIHLAKESVMLKARQFIFIDQNVRHELAMEKGKGCSLLNLEFDCSENTVGVSLQQLKQQDPLFRQFLEEPVPYRVCYDHYQTGYALKDLITELNRAEAQWSYLLEILFIRLLLDLARCAAEKSSQSGIRYLRRAEEFIQQHLSEELKVEQVAGEAGINHSYLQSLFSKYHHCGIGTYINNLRIDKAAFLLENSSMSVTDIGFYVGFNSRQHFGYTFEKRMEMSPNHYRKLHRKNIDLDTKGAQIVLTEQEEKQLIHLVK